MRKDDLEKNYLDGDDLGLEVFSRKGDQKH